jgi:hypothetical protein
MKLREARGLAPVLLVLWLNTVSALDPKESG